MKTNQPRQLRVSLAFLRLRLGLFIIFARNIVQMMTANSNYATPFPALAILTTALDELEVKAQDALGRDHLAIVARNGSFDSCANLFRQEASYVQMECQNDLDILLSSGFISTKAPAPIGPLATPSAPLCRQGTNSGVLRARTDRVYGAKAHAWRVALASAPTVYVQTAQTSSSRNTFSDLTPGQTYLVEVSAFGTAGQSDWSIPGELMVI
ncbi:MAG TPA: fibronectin type III domain-containing protein [Chthoniobacterales bacterium]|jgi:hypothetical protein